MTKLNRRQAMKLFDRNLPFIAVPSECSPYSQMAITVQRVHPESSSMSFEQWENAFFYYNCGRGAGNRIHYYTAD